MVRTHSTRSLARRGVLLSLLILAAAVRPAAAQEQPAADPAREARLAWFRDAKYGLFIHWACTRSPLASGRGRRFRASASGS